MHKAIIRIFLVIIIFLFTFAKIFFNERKVNTSFEKKMNAFKPPWEKQEFLSPIKEIIDFEKKFGWSLTHYSLVSFVTDKYEDIKLVEKLLLDVNDKFTSQTHRSIILSEIITKILAYRSLQKGQSIFIPLPYVNEKCLYKVDEVIDLWNGMPAFGLLPVDNFSAPAILLFRGTDGSFKSKSSWSSVLSDFDWDGPGFKVFKHSREKIHKWLLKAHDKHRNTVVMGYSLGGVLSSYTLLYEYEFLSKDPKFYSIAFNPPGVSTKLVQQWEELSEEKRPSFTVFITENDLVSMVGLFFGNIYYLQTNEKMLPLPAHVTLMGAKEEFLIVPYAEHKETRLSETSWKQELLKLMQFKNNKEK